MTVVTDFIPLMRIFGLRYLEREKKAIKYAMDNEYLDLTGLHFHGSYIYSPKIYSQRTRTFLKEFRPRSKKAPKLRLFELTAFLRSIWVLGLREKGRRYYWRLLAWTLIKRPRSFSLSVTPAIYGFRFRKVVEKYTKPPVQSSI